MLSGQNYREFIEQQGQIEKNIAQGWGYQIDQKQYIPKREKINCNIKVANIQPLRQIYDLPISKKLEQVQEELLMLQNQRKLNELTQNAIESTKRGEVMDVEEAAAVKMMRQCIQQYNFIIDHRHIAEKNSEKARKILGIQKSQSKELFEQIHVLKGQMGQTTLANTIKINSEIAKLYKKYSSIVPRSVNCSDRTTTQNNKSTGNRAITSINTSSYMGTSKFSPNKRTGQKNSTEKESEFKDSHTKKESRIQLKDLVIMQELNESQEGESMQQSQAQEELSYQPQSLLIHHAITKMQRRVSEYAAPRRRFVTVADMKQREKQEKKERMVTTMQEAYEKKQVINKGKKLDKMIQEHHEVIDVWRHRITQNQEKNQSFHLRFQGKERAKKFKSVNNTRRAAEYQAKIAEEQLTSKGVKIHYKAQEIQQNLAEKQRILSLLLSKKQSKFKRIPGTQIMQKNDVNSTAKIFLGISKHQHMSRQPTQRPCMNNKTILDLPQWQNLQEEDEKLYWSRCKNQKLNLLLKSRKIQ